MSEKRYYWLKLKNTYFKQLNQVKMRRQEYGKDMQIIYLKMMLHSLENNGEIYYEGVFGSLAEEIALKIDEDAEIVEKTLDFLKESGMITILSNDSESIAIPETVDCTGSESYSAERVRRYREKKRYNVTDLKQDVTDCNQEKERENREDIEKEERVQIPYQEIADLYNDICISFPRLTKLSEARKKAIRARYNKYSLEDFKKLFEMAEGSSFLKGSNGRNWSATFDWLIKDSNMAKVLDGNYMDKPGQTNKKLEQPKKPYQQFESRDYSKEKMDELERMLLSR